MQPAQSVPVCLVTILPQGAARLAALEGALNAQFDEQRDATGASLWPQEPCGYRILSLLNPAISPAYVCSCRLPG
jgi:hypothetical protein